MTVAMALIPCCFWWKQILQVMSSLNPPLPSLGQVHVQLYISGCQRLPAAVIGCHWLSLATSRRVGGPRRRAASAASAASAARGLSGVDYGGFQASKQCRGQIRKVQIARNSARPKTASVSCPVESLLHLLTAGSLFSPMTTATQPGPSLPTPTLIAAAALHLCFILPIDRSSSSQA